MNRYVMYLVAVVASLSLGVAATLQALDGGPAPAPASPVVVPSAESHISLLNGPPIEKTHQGMRDEDFALSGDAAGVKIPSSLPLATPSQRGCSTNLVRNFSSRNGASPRLFVLHYTVSANRAGTSDVRAIYNWFNSAASQSSSNYIIDFEGNCYYIVSEARKAWTQGSFNPVSISIEFIATGQEPRSAWGERGLRKGALVVADAIKRWKIPLRWVNPVGCGVVAGITDHNNLECGNGHTDVRPNFPYTKFLSYVRAASSATTTKRVRFEIRSGGERVALSSTINAGRLAEARKLKAFLGNNVVPMSNRTRDGDSILILRQRIGGVARDVRLVRLVLNERARFEIRDEGTVIARSTGVVPGQTRERSKLVAFLGNSNASITDALRRSQ